MSERRFLILDYETRSEVDLKKAGAFEYARHSSTQILCAAWRFGTRDELQKQLQSKKPANIWSPAFPETKNARNKMLSLMSLDSTQVVAHNAFFEQVITKFVLSRQQPKPPQLDHDKWICTASMAAALALPRNLEGACLALSLPIQKDMDGRRLILKYCKPRKATKNNSAKWHSSVTDLKRIMQYCQTDVDAETLLFLTIPELNQTERKVWLLDQKVNFRGFEADRELVDKALSMIEEEAHNLNKETKQIAGSAFTSTNQRAQVLSWLETEGYFLPDLRAKTVGDAISMGLIDGKPKRLLEIRQAISKTSTAKYAAFELRSRSDGRVRDNLLYHGASTGRWSGIGVQPQNFPRGNVEDTTTAAEVLKTGDLEWVRCLYGNPMNVFSSCLRSVITAPKGRELFCADYASIEARVLFWVAEHIDGLKAFNENRPLYEEMAAVIYNVELNEVTKPWRQVGKQALLGCGYGMGHRKFLQTCLQFGIEIDGLTSERAVKSYRSTHYPVVKLWGNLERAAIAAVKTPGKRFKINKTIWWISNDFLWCELPSGRRLAYYKPEVKYETTPWDEKRAVLYHFSVNPLTRKWESSGTYGGKLTENVVQAIARDLMAEAMLRIEAAGYDLVLSVHDELLAEREKGRGSVKEFEKLMGTLPVWAVGAPVKVEGWSGPRYKK